MKCTGACLKGKLDRTQVSNSNLNARNKCSSNALHCLLVTTTVGWKGVARNPTSGAEKVMKLQTQTPWPKPTKTQKWFCLILTFQDRPKAKCFSIVIEARCLSNHQKNRPQILLKFSNQIHQYFPYFSWQAIAPTAETLSPTYA